MFCVWNATIFHVVFILKALETVIKSKLITPSLLRKLSRSMVLCRRTHFSQEATGKRSHGPDSVPSLGRPSRGRDSSPGPFAQDVCLLGFEPGSQTMLKTGPHVPPGLAKSQSTDLPQEGAERGQRGGPGLRLGRLPTQLSGLSPHLGKQSQHRWAPAVI